MERLGPDAPAPAVDRAADKSLDRGLTFNRSQRLAALLRTRP